MLMEKIFFLLQLFFSPLLLCGQLFIKGKVTDDATQSPLKGASVYINNSTRGTNTDENGEFEIGPLEPGRYEVVASYVGYTPLLFTAELINKGVKISFRLDKKETILREVLVLTDETRRQYLEIFKKNVLGLSVAAERSRIKNIDEVQFTTGENKNEIQAYTEKELEIENPELGYTIYFELLDFYFHKTTRSTYFFGYTRFVDWEQNGKTKKRWIKERRDTYFGSTVHFFRSLVKKELSKQGFTAYQLSQPVIPKTDTVKGKNSFTVTIGGGQGMQAASRITEDSMFSIYPDSVFSAYELLLRNGWRIVYNKSTKLKQELMRKTFIGGQMTNATVSGLRFREKPVLVSEKGILLTPMNLFFDGIWGFERLANMLPEDYKPD